MENYKTIVIIYDPIKDVAVINSEVLSNRTEILEEVYKKLNTLRNEALSNTINS